MSKAYKLIGTYRRPHHAKGILRAWLIDRSNHVSIRFEVLKMKGTKQALEMPIDEWRAHCIRIESDVQGIEGAFRRGNKADGSELNNA